MKFLYATCNEMIDLLPGYCKLFNKYWGLEQEVDVLGFDPPSFDLPKNFKFVSLGKQEDYPNKVWTDPILPIIKNLKEEYFVLALADLFPINYVRKDLVEKGIRLIKEEKVQKIAFFKGSEKQNSACLPFDEDFIVLGQHAEYRSALEPGLWSKQHFLKYAERGMTAWDYEIKNMRRSTCDGAVILFARDKPIFPWVNVLVKGRFNYKIWDQIQKTAALHWSWSCWHKLNSEDIQIYERYKDLYP